MLSCQHVINITNLLMRLLTFFVILLNLRHDCVFHTFSTFQSGCCIFLGNMWSIHKSSQAGADREQHGRPATWRWGSQPHLPKVPPRQPPNHCSGHTGGMPSHSASRAPGSPLSLGHPWICVLALVPASGNAIRLEEFGLCVWTRGGDRCLHTEGSWLERWCGYFIWSFMHSGQHLSNFAK